MATYHTDMLASLPLINSSPRKTVSGQGLPVKHSVFIQNWGFKSFKIIQLNFKEKKQNVTVMMQEPAPLFLNCDFKICLRAHKLLGDLRETGPWLKTERH